MRGRTYIAITSNLKIQDLVLEYLNYGKLLYELPHTSKSVYVKNVASPDGHGRYYTSQVKLYIAITSNLKIQDLVLEYLNYGKL